MDIGIPKEVKLAERRVALTPNACQTLIGAGHRVHVESGAGIQAGFSDALYQKTGATIAAAATALYENSQLIVKVKEPQPSEWALLRNDHLLFCYLHLAANPHLTAELVRIGLTAVAFETVAENGETPLLAPMSAIAGRLSIQLGAYYLQAENGGRGVLLGGTNAYRAGHVTVIGAGVAGREAATLAHHMGASVTVLDINTERLDALKQALPTMNTAISSPAAINALLSTTDLLIGAVYMRGKRSPHVVTARQIREMPRGSVVIDISIDQGGCIETARPCTYANPVYEVHGVLHSAITNLPAAVPNTASHALSQAILPYVLSLAEEKWTDALITGLNVQHHTLKIHF